MLFNISTKPLGEVIKRSELWGHQYADETELNLTSQSDPTHRASGNPEPVSGGGWMKATKLKLNSDKMAVLIHKALSRQGETAGSEGLDFPSMFLHGY